MGLSASQARLLLLTARKSDLEFRAQQISQKRLVLSQQLEEIARDYEEAASNRVMSITVGLNGDDTNGDSGKSDPVNQTINLTYAALISGTLRAVDEAQSGIKSTPLTKLDDGKYSSGSNYRLVDIYGAIVVSSVDEIPTEKKETLVKASSEISPNLYEQQINSDGTQATNYYITAGNLKNDSALSKAIANLSDSQKASIEVAANCLVRIGSKYYNIQDGSEVTSQKSEVQRYENDKSRKRAAIVGINRDVPDSKIDTVGQLSKTDVEGKDGRYRIKDANGNVIQTYVVDTSLRRGLTDSAGDKSGPNYLQDCLRNGKYLMEKGDKNPDTSKFEWHSLSWDSATNINDSYYTADDDKAKAKYDRLQTQIQNQDKKYEIELDNVETQRNAVKTEIESDKKIIEDSTEKFNVFG